MGRYGSSQCLMYEELMWDHEDLGLEFSADYKNNQIIIRNRSQDSDLS